MWHEGREVKIKDSKSDLWEGRSRQKMVKCEMRVGKVRQKMAKNDTREERSR